MAKFRTSIPAHHPLHETREAMKAALYLAMVVGAAHARQMLSPDRPKWREGLARHRSIGLNVPNWLRSSILELMASHEIAYLEHCPRYAANPGVAACTKEREA